jgi:hypothetical protein
MLRVLWLWFILVSLSIHFLSLLLKSVKLFVRWETQCKNILLFALMFCISRVLSRVAAVTSPTGIPQCPPTPTHHARPANKSLQDQELLLCANRTELLATVADADLGTILNQI